MTAVLLAGLLTLLPMSPAGAAGPAQRSEPSAEAAAARDKLASSLFFRGELADMIVAAGEAGLYADLAGIETYSGVRGALMDWIRRDPAAAAEVYLRLKGGGGRRPPALEETAQTWELNPSFLEAVKELSSAADSPYVSREAMEMAARRLYGRAQAGDGAPVLDWGGSGSGGRAAGTRSDFADFKIDKAGLAAELGSMGQWLEALKPAARDAAATAAYEAALAAYREFLVASSGLKLVTEQGSRRLEELRRRLRSSLAAASLLVRAGELRAAATALEKSGAPGSSGMKDSLLGLAARLEGTAASAGAEDMGALGRLVNSSEDRFAALYLGFTVYDGLLRLREKMPSAGFSCLYDYAVYSYLAAFFPDSPYPKARRELAAYAEVLDEALTAAGAGAPDRALSLADPARIEAAYAAARRASSHNRRAQLLNWGLFFRPVELTVSVKGGKASFRPVFAIAETLSGR
ncbi:MAG: hypothetical protein M0011_00460 [Elusimicrobia bacterium]|nr:hypothetical protein [Elusimicrobiota bacterium]